MSTQTERRGDIEDRHHRGQWIMAIGLAIGTFATAAEEGVEMLGGAPTAETVLTFLAMAGFVVFLFGVMNARVRGHCQELLTGVIDDEFVRTARFRAYSTALVTVIVLQLALKIGDVFLRKAADISMSVGFTTDLTFAVALTVALGRFLYLTRE